MTGRLKCKVRDPGRFRFRWRVPDRFRVRFRVRSQEARGAEPTAEQWCPGWAELRAKGRVPVRISPWLPIPHTSIAPWLGGFRNILGQLQPGLGNDMVSFHVPCRVNLHHLCTPGVWCCQILVLDTHREIALGRVRVLSRDAAKAEATPFS